MATKTTTRKTGLTPRRKTEIRTLAKLMSFFSEIHRETDWMIGRPIMNGAEHALIEVRRLAAEGLAEIRDQVHSGSR